MKKKTKQGNASCLISFDNYLISKMDYRLVDVDSVPLRGKKKKDVSINIKHDVIVDEDAKHATVILRCEIGKDVDSNCPFHLTVELNGFFSYKPVVRGCNVSFDRMCNLNATAILYPYLRSIVTDITKTANVPPLILPAMNINKILGTEQSLSLSSPSKS